MRASRLTRGVVLAALPLALSLAACSFSSKSSPTTPDTAIVTLLMGSWTSSGTTSVGAASSCGGFQWQVTSQNGDTVTGTFSATCGSGVTLDGSATGVSNDNQVTWNASGTAHIPNQADCPFTLNGVATVNGDTATLPYSGSSCMGAVSGTETLTKH
ncbi:MAG TPA: hypothetical protein VIC33_06325 [Vicinamibacterales bacterium]|jgi:hypothetical protein